MKFLRFSLITSLLLLLFPLSCTAIEPPTERFYINDFANILNDETEQYIFEHSAQLYEATTAQIVVVTVPNLEGKSLEEYSLELARNYGIGDKEKSNGLLLLLALEERQFRVEVGDGLEGALPDARTGRIQDQYIIPYLKDNKWDEGVLNGYKAFFQIVAEEYNYDSDVAPTAASNDFDTVGFLAILGQFISFTLVPGIVPSFFGSSKRDKSKQKTIKVLIFVILQAITTGIFFIIYSHTGLVDAIITYPFFTVFNIIIAFASGSSTSGRGGRSHGGWFSSSSGSRGGSSFSGGGGSFSGGGSSRGF